ncbi:MAG: branched-chain amino acid ABC transporter permease [Candidatus Nanopelagicales bacterium]|jgi:branched-chain amino acid transport system permease protein|nr:branched-chain amino acid ABC transporter permease [Candidatus Nanopelagicales bacterium]
MTTATAVEQAEMRIAMTRKEAVGRLLGVVLLLGVAAWLVLNLVTAPSQFFNSLLFGIGNGALYALIALGYTLVYGIIELINFAHGDLFMLSTVFSGFMMVYWLGAEGANPASWAKLLLTLVLAMGFGATINVLIERVAYRRLRRAPRLAALITAVGMSFILQWVGLRWNGSAPRLWPTVVPEGGISIGDVTLQYSTIMVVTFTIPVLLLLTYVVQRTKQGRAMRATAQDQDAARLMGINVDRTIAFTFALGGAMAGAAGLLYLEAVGTTRYDAGFHLGLIAFTAAVLGGIGNLAGAVLGGFLIGIIQGLNDGLPYGFGQKWSQTVVFSILIMVMVFKPTGILGQPTVEKV